MTEREDGFYWVKYHGEWIICYWKNDGFYSGFTGYGWYEPEEENKFDEIDERRLVKND